MENNETAVCKIKAFCCSKTFLVIAACVVCFFVGFFSGNAAGKAAQRKADASIIAAANARANAARLRRVPNVRPTVRRVNTNIARTRTTANRRVAANRPAARPAATVNRTQTKK